MHSSPAMEGNGSLQSNLWKRDEIWGQFYNQPPLVNHLLPPTTYISLIPYLTVCGFFLNICYCVEYIFSYGPRSKHSFLLPKKSKIKRNKVTLFFMVFIFQKVLACLLSRINVWSYSQRTGRSQSQFSRSMLTLCGHCSWCICKNYTGLFSTCECWVDSKVAVKLAPICIFSTISLCGLLLFSDSFEERYLKKVSHYSFRISSNY